MKRMLLLLIVLTAALPARSAEEPAPSMTRTDTRWSTSVGNPPYGGNCIVYTPPNFDERATWPLIVFFHGAGGKGEDIAKLNKEFIPTMLDDGRVLEAIVICPQARDYWQADEAVAALEFTLAQMPDRVDPDRIYVTGLSSGGGAAWRAANAHADRIAALAPLCPHAGDVKDTTNLAAVPIWTFHNVHDPYCPVDRTRRMVEALRSAGNERVQYTELTETVGKYNEGKQNWPNTHADAWIKAYSDPAFWDWLFAQRRTDETHE